MRTVSALHYVYGVKHYTVRFADLDLSRLYDTSWEPLAK